MLASFFTGRKSSPLPVASYSAVPIHNVSIITSVICVGVIAVIWWRSSGVPIWYGRCCSTRARTCVENKKDPIFCETCVQNNGNKNQSSVTYPPLKIGLATKNQPPLNLSLLLVILNGSYNPKWENWPPLHSSLLGVLNIFSRHFDMFYSKNAYLFLHILEVSPIACCKSLCCFHS